METVNLEGTLQCATARCALRTSAGSEECLLLRGVFLARFAGVGDSSGAVRFLTWAASGDRELGAYCVVCPQNTEDRKWGLPGTLSSTWRSIKAGRRVASLTGFRSDASPDAAPLSSVCESLNGHLGAQV